MDKKHPLHYLPQVNGSYKTQHLKIFVIVISKEGLAFFRYDTIKRIVVFIVDVIPKEALAVPQPANPSWGMTTTKTLRY